MAGETSIGYLPGRTVTKVGIKKYTSAAIEGWVEAGPIHGNHTMPERRNAFSSPGFSVFDELKIELLVQLLKHRGLNDR